MKTVSSILAGMFVLLLAGGFILGSTNLSDIFGPDKTIIAQVETEKIPFHQFVKFRRFLRYQKKRDASFNEDKFRYEVLEILIRLHLMKKLMYSWGYIPSKEELKDFQVNFARNKKGKFDKESLINFRRSFNFTDKDFELLLIERNFFDKLDDFAVVNDDDARFQLISSSAKFQVAYVFLEKSKLNSILSKNIRISKKEIEAEFKKESKKIKEQGKGAKSKKQPKLDNKKRKAIIRKLKKQKVAQAKISLEKKLQKLIKKGAGLGTISRISKIPITTSTMFEPGSQIRSKQKMAPGLADSPEFIDQIRKSKLNSPLGPIKTPFGEYFVALKKRQIPLAREKYKNLKRELAKRNEIQKSQMKRTIYQDILESYRNKFKIKKFDSQFFQK